MKNSILAILTMFFFVVSCNDRNTINMKITNVNGLKEKLHVLSKGIKVGEVAEISIFNRKYVNVLLELDENFHIPIGSEASLISTDIMGTRAISLELSNNDDYYGTLDTLLCIDKSATILDSMLIRINTAIEEIADSIPKLINENQK